MKEILRKIKQWIIRRLKFFRRIGLKNRNFTIVSINCVGGYIYQYYGIAYNTPTAGLLFDAADFIKICKDPKRYLTHEPEIIAANESQRAGILAETENWGKYPVGRVDDVEIFFMHYPTVQEAIDKWKRRCQRMNYDKMIFLLAQNESCDESIIREFCNLPLKHKVCLTYDKFDIPGTVYSEEVHGLEGHPWRPEIVQKIVDWKQLINSL